MSDYYSNSPSGAPYSPPNSTTALISLIAGITGLTIFPFIGSIVAVITGTMARREIRESAGALSGDGLATAGLVLGWIGIGLGVLGICGFAIALGIPFCLALFGLAQNGTSLVIPAVFLLG